MRARTSIVALIVAGAMALSACSTVVDGHPSAAVAQNANLIVVGDSNSPFDITVKNALSDVIAFWKINYPRISGGKALPEMKGGFYSIDAADVVQSGKVSGPAAKEGCVADDAEFIIDNAAYCRADDSIVWDRNPDHLIGALAQKYGKLLIALAFAHEFGHALQQRLGIFNHPVSTIDTESQADCAAGAFMAQVSAGKAAHFRATPDDLDSALNGYLQVRDKTPDSPQDISHGNGFDRLSAIDDGVLHGPTFCYSDSYFNRDFTERPFVSDNDYQTGGNETLEQVLNPGDPTKDSTAGGLQPDLNRFWKKAAGTISKNWADVKIAEADHPKCGSTSTSEFGYCPDDNTVYYSHAYAEHAYNSLTERHIDPTTKDVSLVDNQPADFALGTLFAISWGLAVRHQLFAGSIEDRNALLAAACYSGAYSKDVNLAQNDGEHSFLLSPPDMDEATSAMLNLVGEDRSFGARGTTGLQRVQAFVKGYQGGLSVC
jgi:predicted metalloprotease